MADGAHQQTRFDFTALDVHAPVCQHATDVGSLLFALRDDEMGVDLFAGGGGVSEAFKQVFGYDPAIAINHDREAIGMHEANHPNSRHMCEDIWQADPVQETRGRTVGWCHASPDCTHHSQARGGQPRSRATRSLSWVILKWAGMLAKQGRAPRIISLENVHQITQWTRLVARRCKTTGRVVRLDGTVAAPGERVPLQDQWLVPDKKSLGRTWERFVAALRALGYDVQWRKLKASDYGAGTRRTRLFMIARRDGEAIRWPAPTHGKHLAQATINAADSIDWSIPSKSIFNRDRPLAEATMRRICKGVRRYVLDSDNPYFVDHSLVAAFLTEHANGSSPRCFPLDEPLRTQCAGVKGGHFALVEAQLVPAQQFAAFLDQANGGFYDGAGNDMRKPFPTICAHGSQQRLVTAELQPANELLPEHEQGALRVAAFFIRYHGSGGQFAALDEPITTITTKDRLALVTVIVRGDPFVIVDIRLRLLHLASCTWHRVSRRPTSLIARPPGND
jgi:DNA (cytosine-5)-methyltransferase 1